MSLRLNSSEATPIPSSPTPAISQASPATGRLTPDDWYRIIPKQLLQNAHWRQWLLEKAQRDPRLQHLIKRACRESILFWINTFMWGLDPRRTQGQTQIPFVTFQGQDRALLKMQQAMYPRDGKQRDVVVEKTRDEGATFLCVFVFLHSWQFNADRHELFAMSWKEALTDGGDKSIFGKADLALDCQPAWLLPEGWNRRKHRTTLNIENPETGSVWSGEGTSILSGTGGRFRAMFFDEYGLVKEAETLYAKSANCTDCRIFNSTHFGTHTRFYKITEEAKKPNSRTVLVRLHWSDHPWKVQNLREGPDGRLTSDWREDACARLGWNKKSIAEEIDIDPVNAADLFFEASEIARLIDSYAREPDLVGDMLHGRFAPGPGGNLKLWCKLGPDGMPPIAEYVIGCDVASGIGGPTGSPSCLSIVNIDTGQKVGEAAFRDLKEHEFADYTHAVAQLFHRARVNWENRGPGGAFKKQLVQVRGYSRVYIAFRKDNRKLFGQPADVVGFSPTQESNRYALTAYRAALSTGNFLNHSESALKECLQYVFTSSGEIDHSRRKDKSTPLTQGFNHGDQVRADALANLFMDDRLREANDPDKGVTQTKELTPDGYDPLSPPYGSMAWRDMQEDRRLAEASLDGW